MNNDTTEYPLDEFVSYQLTEDQNRSEFVITIKGDIQYAHLIAEKICNLTFTVAEMSKTAPTKPSSQ